MTPVAAAPVTPLAPVPVEKASATPAEKPKPAEPFTFADFSWLTGNSRQKDYPLDTKVFTGEFRLDTNYVHDFNHPKDNTLVGSSELGRVGEFQVQQLGIGGDFHYQNIRGRLLTQFGMYSTMTPRNDASPGRGQWSLDNAYRYVSEAYGGYHIDKLHGINIDAGIFMSYVGLYSYYQFDNWAYQPSYVPQTRRGSSTVFESRFIQQRSSRSNRGLLTDDNLTESSIRLLAWEHRYSGVRTVPFLSFQTTIGARIL